MSGTELGTTELKFGTGSLRLFWDAANSRLDIVDDDDNVLIRIDPLTGTSFPGGVAAFDLDEPPTIGGTTPAAITGTTITATTGVTVSRPAETTAGLSLITSAGTAQLAINSAGVLLITTPGTSTGLYCNSTGLYIQRILRPDNDNARDLGTAASRWRHLYMGGDLYVGGGDINGPTDGNLSINSDGDIVFRFDADNDGTNTIAFKNGEGTSVLSIDETGELAVTGLTTTGDIAVGDDLAVTGRISTPTIPTFNGDDTTPSVAAGNIFKTADSGSAVTITTLDDPATGQTITILPTASPVTTIDADAIVNMDTDWLSSAGTVLRLVYDGSDFWKE